MPPGFARQTAGTVSFPLPNGFADYGQFWWTSDRYGPRLWIAAGFRQQYVVVVPEYDMVVVMQSQSYDPPAPIVDHFHLVTQYLLAAVTSP